MQFHWENAGYGSFEDFLSALSSRKRKTLRRERRDANDAGLTFGTLTGRRDHEAALGRILPVLHLDGRSQMGIGLSHAPVLHAARRAPGRPRGADAGRGRPARAAAGALNLAGADTLYGRNWGCIGDWPFLHFELCYYRAIDYAIAHGLRRVEAGAQGRHKIQRGYLPQATLLRALDRASRTASRHRAFPRQRAAGGPGRDGRARDRDAVQAGGGRLTVAKTLKPGDKVSWARPRVKPTAPWKRRLRERSA